VPLTIIEFHVGKAPIRSLAQGMLFDDARASRVREVRYTPTSHDSRPPVRVAHTLRNPAGPEISAGHNFEVQHERRIFHMRKPSDEA